MTSLQSSYATTKNTTYFINETAIISAFKYDQNGIPDSQPFITGVDTRLNKSHVSTSNIILDSTSLSATITCDASFTSNGGDWNARNGLWVETSDTYPADKPLTITFNSPNAPTRNDWRIALINASPQPPDGAGTSTIPDSQPYLYFWDANTYTSETVFTIEWDGASTLTFKADGNVIDTSHTGVVFPDGIKLYMVFNDGVPDNRKFVVNVTVPASPIPANSLLCKSMGRTYQLRDETYVKVQNKKDVDDVFYFKVEDNAFVSLNAS